MKRTYDPQIDKYHNRLEYGDKISIVVDDETAERIRKEDAAAIEKGYDSPSQACQSHTLSVLSPTYPFIVLYAPQSL